MQFVKSQVKDQIPKITFNEKKNRNISSKSLECQDFKNGFFTPFLSYLNFMGF
jgi:hypothetical protein